MNDWQQFYGPNAGYIAELYERYREDPESVDPQTRAFFQAWQPPAVVAPAAPAAAVAAPAGERVGPIVGASNLAQAIRASGHLAARLDPLGSPPHGDPALEPATHGITEEDLAALPASVVGGPAAEGARDAREAIGALRSIYTDTTGYEVDHVHEPEERAWLREAIEVGHYCEQREPIDDRRLLERLSVVEAFERFLHRTYPGQTRFSIEGLDMLVPMLDEVVDCAIATKTCEIVLSMAHRGRLNVLAHVLGKPYTDILAEFEGKIAARGIGPAEGSLEGWTGDVKYHLGGYRAYHEGDIVNILVTMPPNPSHLEYIDPVAEGMARALDDTRDEPGPPGFYQGAAIPVLIHGDAAFPGQGVVAETLNFSFLEGYTTGGTIHIIANNQLGFTAEPNEFRSTHYASDLAKGFDVPIVHVNADDPLACAKAIRLATSYRQRFHKDFLIDLVGYRRWGHNEGDDPALTQPRMYDVISSHPTVRELWAQRLIGEGLVKAEEAEGMVQAAYERLQEARNAVVKEGQVEELGPDGRKTVGAEEIRTAVGRELLRSFNEHICRLPEGFAVNPRLARVLQRRCSALAPEGRIDWGQAEMLAFASILADGVPIRLSGQDVCRGTFSQRHLVLHDQQTGETYVPLQHLAEARASFAVYNSPLTENATMGFEYGYSAEAVGTLVLWEAQYGDFVNGAQVMVDQFIMSGRAKWQQSPSLVLLLPHAYEGQGPEHSSARLERFLQLAAERNVRIANCSTAGQYFHLLRWQAALLKSDPRPLIVLSPKSLLRLPEAAASVDDLAEGGFRGVIDDEGARGRADRIRRLMLCSGKIYYDLVASEQYKAAEETAVARLELLYPFPTPEVEALVAGYPDLTEIVWVQEEPENMGAWNYVAPRLRQLVPRNKPVKYVGRPRRASPAEGVTAWHAEEQRRIVEMAFRGAMRPQQVIRGARHGG